MSLRDELAQALDPICGERATQAVYIIEPIIERALAAERAATIEECTCRMMDGLAEHSQVSPIFLSGIRWCAEKLTTVPRDRAALDFAKKMATAEARHEMNQRIGEHLGQDANEKSTLQMLDDALAQARREEGTASFVLGAEFGFRSGERGNNLEATLADAAAAIRAPAAPARQRGEQED